MIRLLHYVNDEARPGFNLALEQVVLARAPGPAFMLWRNGPSVIVGRHQSAADEVDLAAAADAGVRVYRRASGGGAVYHDLGTVNFSFALPADAPVGEALAAFVALLGAPAAATERNDVLVAGRKAVGTAQRLCGSRRLFHGCLLYDTDLGALARLLTPSPRKLARHGVASVGARVANLREITGSGLGAAEFLDRLRRKAAEAFAGQPKEIPAAWRAEALELAATPPFLPVFPDAARKAGD